MFAISNDENASKCAILSELKKFGIPYKTWYRWTKRADWDEFVSASEKQHSNAEHEARQYNNNSSTFSNLRLFYKSDSYKNNIQWSEFLENRNYWFWRKHFISPLNLDDNFALQNQWHITLSDQHYIEYSHNEDSSSDDDNNNNNSNEEISADNNNHNLNFLVSPSPNIHADDTEEKDLVLLDDDY